jgi:S-disulfanyl-L-cysteine oxidoreductase SoxD
MSRFCNALCVIVLLLPAMALSATSFKGVGRAATLDEIAAWDIDVRPDFKGLPKGTGSVTQGSEIFEAKCAACHGTFGESNEVFTPLIGGTSADDIKTGRVRALANGDLPQRTSFTKVATLSTLFDYIQRAMPWTAPKSLTPNEVYAVLAYMLNLADIVPADFVLTDANIAAVQQRMPNRHGMSTVHALWPGAGQKTAPDVRNTACMKNCKAQVQIGSVLPSYARTAHGNLAEQNRSYGAIRGIETVPLGEQAQAAIAPSITPALDLASKHGCLACHAQASRVVGPSFKDIYKRHKDSADAQTRLMDKVRRGGEGVWGTIPMPANEHVDGETLRLLIKWILDGAN